MRNIETLKNSLLHSESVEGRTLYHAARRLGYDSQMACCLAYKAGMIDGRNKERRKTREAYKKLEDYKALHASNAQMTGIADLINHPKPERTMEDVENSRTPGEDLEVKKNDAE